MTSLQRSTAVLAAFVASVTLITTQGCGPRGDAKASPTTRQDSSAPDTQSRGSAAGEVASADTGKKRDTSKKADTSRKTDSAIKIKLLPGRSKKDSFSLAASIRAARKVVPTWPKGPDPIGPAVLPAKRIVAFYGNPLSKKMGVLGEYPVEEMLAKLDKEVAAWRAADPATPVQPALHLIAVVAQQDPGKDGKYRLRMDTALINKVYGWAQRKGAILFLDIQVAKSTLQEEMPRLLPYLAKPDVHLGIDPEFSMHYSREGLRPGVKIGTMDAADVNYAIGVLAKVAADNNLPPKILVVHRFTQNMVQNAAKIRPDPRVQVVMNMDGWGQPWLKFDSYRAYTVAEPVQFTGFKLFYHNDTKKGDALLTPAEVLHLLPRPLYIQYQ